MNKWEQEVQQSLLNDEKEALAELERLYNKALKDIGDKVKAFAYDISVLDAALEEEGLDDAQRKLLQSRRQAKVYQKQYQDALQGQISDVVDKLHADEYETLHGYLTECYDNAFMGTLYNIQKQGIPLMLPIDQTAAVRAVLLNSKLSAGLYARLGIDLQQMKADVSREVTRGIAANMQYRDIARNIKNVSGVTMGRGRLIARTEGHRIQQQSNYDAQQRAKGIGADVVKQWDATLDSRTRESHAAVDGEIREVEKPFSNGLMFPGDPAGAAAEVCNCRCTSNTRAKWALSAEQTKWLGDVSKMSDKQKELISGKLGIPVDELDNYSKTIVPLNAKGFDDFKEKYKALRNPEDERIIREAEERIAGYKAARKTKKSEKMSSKTLENSEKSDRIEAGNNPWNFDSIQSNNTINDDIGSLGKPVCNPLYSTGQWGYTQNCQRCVPAFEFRRRGFDVVAAEMPQTNSPVLWGTECFSDNNGNPVSFTLGQTYGQLQDELANAPDGARYSIYVAWRRGASHVFVAVKEAGKVVYVDPQTGNTDASAYFFRAKPGMFGFFRMDDKQISSDIDIVKKTVERAK